jgi:hypothetical protein
MKYINSFRTFLNEEKGVSIDKTKETLDQYVQENKCQHDLSKPGIKIYFDITDWKHTTQNNLGRSIILADQVKKSGFWKTVKNLFIPQIKNKMKAANHVGFIFTKQVEKVPVNDSIEVDDIKLQGPTIFHATWNETGVEYVNDFQEIMKNPENFIVWNLGGDESKLKQTCDKILQNIKNQKKSGTSYDKPGLIRQLPVIGKFLSNTFVAKEETPYSFYCSELVANILVRTGVITFQELKQEFTRLQTKKESKTTELDKIDEISPQELYDYLCNRPNVEVMPLICKNINTGETSILNIEGVE